MRIELFWVEDKHVFTFVRQCSSFFTYCRKHLVINFRNSRLCILFERYSCSYGSIVNMWHVLQWDLLPSASFWWNSVPKLAVKKHSVIFLWHVLINFCHIYHDTKLLSKTFGTLLHVEAFKYLMRFTIHEFYWATNIWRIVYLTVVCVNFMPCCWKF